MDGNDEKHLIQKLLKLEKENALLKAQIGKMTSKDVSLSASDVSNQTLPRIAKPPNYNERDSEEDDDFDEARPPPDQHDLTTEAQNEREPAKESNANGATENEDGVKVDSIVHLDNDTVHDGNGKKTPESVKETNNEGEGDGGEEIVREGGAEGEEKGVAKKDEKSHDQNSWVLVNKDGEKGKDTTDGNYDVDNVTELVDRVESAVEATSKDEPGAFDGLVVILQILLPLTLFMADEVKMLRGNKKDLLRRNRTLMKENQQVRLEAEQRVLVETKSVATSPDMPEEDKTIKEDKCKAGKSEEQDNKQLIIEAQKREVKKLRLQVKELQHVNLAWEKYSHKKTSRYEAEMRKMKTKLAASEEKGKKLEKRIEDKFRHYDQTLMDVKRSEERQKLIGAQYKKERDTYQLKYEEMKRQLKEQDEEIKRLNEVIVRKETPKVYMKPAALVVTQQARVVDDKHAAAAARRKTDHREKQDAIIAAALAATAVGSPSDRDKGKAKDAKQQKAKAASPPLSPRGPPGYMNDNNPMSLTREELKDQMVLYKEQIDVYRADFNQERRDREKAVGQVDSLKKELEKTKKRVKEMQRQRMQEEHDLYAAGRLGRMRFLPEDTQEMRLREIKEQARGKSKYPAYGRQYGEANLDVLEADLDLPEEHLYADIE